MMLVFFFFFSAWHLMELSFFDNIICYFAAMSNNRNNYLFFVRTLGGSPLPTTHNATMTPEEEQTHWWGFFLDQLKNNNLNKLKCQAPLGSPIVKPTWQSKNVRLNMHKSDLRQNQNSYFLLNCPFRNLWQNYKTISTL